MIRNVSGERISTGVLFCAGKKESLNVGPFAENAVKETRTFAPQKGENRGFTLTDNLIK